MQDLHKPREVDGENAQILGEIHLDHIKKENVTYRVLVQQNQFSRDKNEL